MLELVHFKWKLVASMKIPDLEHYNSTNVKGNICQYIKKLLKNVPNPKWFSYRRWGDKTSYLKNVKCSGEPNNMAALTV